MVVVVVVVLHGELNNELPSPHSFCSLVHMVLCMYLSHFLIFYILFKVENNRKN